MKLNNIFLYYHYNDQTLQRRTSPFLDGQLLSRCGVNQVELAHCGLQLFSGGLQLLPELNVEALYPLLLLLDVGLLTAQRPDTALHLGINTRARSPSLNQGFP